MKRNPLAAAIAVAGLVLTGCASVDVVKVPTPTQYIDWTDARQAQADAIKGLRFYLPRPFINVREPFPVFSEVFIAEGAVSPDGQYVVMTKVRSDSGLAPYFASELQSVAIPTSKIAVTSTDNLQSNVEGGDENTVVSGGETPTGQPEPEPDTAPDTTDQEPGGTAAPTPVTGQNQQSATNDNGAYAYQPMRGHFDIAYLPDFEEQYAIQSKSNLGNAQFSVNFGQGWSLQSFNSLADNSQINNRIFDLLDSASSVAKAKLDAIAAGFKVSEDDIEQTTELQSAIEQAGTLVSLKVTVVYYAAVGLYPVLKPRELKGAPAPTHDLFGNPAGGALRGPTAPVYPYQYLSFNTYRVMAVEAINPSSNAQQQLIHPTGLADVLTPTSGGKSPVGNGNGNGNGNLKGGGQTVDISKEADDFVSKLKAFTDTIEEDSYKLKITDATKVASDSDAEDLKVIVDVNYESTPGLVDGGSVQTLIKRAVDPNSLLSPNQVLIRPSDAWMNASDAERRKFQAVLCVVQDGDWGANTLAAAVTRFVDTHGTFTASEFAAIQSETVSCP